MPRQVRAAVSPGLGGAPVIEALILDDPLPDELVIEVKAAGVCHTDIGIGQWSQNPRVFGHEGAGVVVEVGDGVTKFRPGDRVVATFGSCGQCRTCRADRPAYCSDAIALNIEGERSRPALTRPDGTVIGGAFFQQSCFATHALVTARNLVTLPDDIDFVTAAPLGCGIQTGAGAVINNFAAKAGEPLLVIGCGAVGLSAVMAGKIMGCAPIIACDPVPARRTLAIEMGAHHVLAETSAEAIRAIEPKGVSYALDTAGIQATFEAGIASLHVGGKLGVLTLPGAFDAPVAHPGGLPFMTTTMIGVIEGDSVPDRFIPWLIEQNRAGALPYDRLIQTFAFDDIGAALHAMETKQAIKPVLVF